MSSRSTLQRHFAILATTAVLGLGVSACGSTREALREEAAVTTSADGGTSVDPADDLPGLSACRQDGMFDLVSTVVDAVDAHDATALTGAFMTDARWSVYEHFGNDALVGSQAIGAFAAEVGQRGDRWRLTGMEPPQEDLGTTPPVATSVVRLTVTVGGRALERRAKITVDCATGRLQRMAGPHSVS